MEGDGGGGTKPDHEDGWIFLNSFKLVGCSRV